MRQKDEPGDEHGDDEPRVMTQRVRQDIPHPEHHSAQRGIGVRGHRGPTPAEGISLAKIFFDLDTLMRVQLARAVAARIATINSFICASQSCDLPPCAHPWEKDTPLGRIPTTRPSHVAEPLPPF